MLIIKPHFFYECYMDTIKNIKRNTQMCTTCLLYQNTKEKARISEGKMDNIKFTDRKKHNKPQFIKRVLFYLYRIKHNSFYSCHIWNFCVNCEYFNICHDEKRAAAYKRSCTGATDEKERPGAPLPRSSEPMRSQGK